MQYLSQDHLNFRQLDIEFINHKEKNWQRIFPSTNYGVEFNHFDFNNQMLGNGFSIAHYLTFNLANKNRLQVQFKPILGLGMISQTFDQVENTKNIAIGSHLNLFVAVGISTKYQIHNDWKLSASVRFNHFSNTGFKLPNLGINVPTLSLGMVHSISQPMRSSKEEQVTNHLGSNSLELSSALGINQVATTENKYYYNQYWSLNYLKINDIKSRYVFGLDYFYSPGNQRRLRSDSIYRSSAVNHQLAATIGHDLVISNVSFRTQLGFYLYNRDVSLSNMYYKVGGNLFIDRKLIPFFGLKTHQAKAEYFFVGLRYQFTHE